MNKRCVTSNQKDILNDILSKGRDIRQCVNEVNLAPDRRFDISSPTFSLKKTPAGIVTGMLLVAGNVQNCREHYAISSSNDEEIGKDQPVSFSSRRLLSVNNFSRLGRKYLRLEGVKKY